MSHEMYNTSMWCHLAAISEKIKNGKNRFIVTGQSSLGGTTITQNQNLKPDVNSKPIYQKINYLLPP